MISLVKGARSRRDADQSLSRASRSDGWTANGAAPCGTCTGDANGDINVSLWDAISGGIQIGSTVMFNGLAVVDGLFNVDLDFGANAFDNTARWLEISVNGSELTPRQPITRTPYTIQARGIFVDANDNVSSGTTNPQRELDVEASEPVMRLTASRACDTRALRCWRRAL